MALIAGVLVGAAVIGPLLSLVYEAYGFVGALLRGHGGGPREPAPRAALISRIANGIVHRTLPWIMVLIGAGQRSPSSGPASSPMRPGSGSR